MDGDHKAPNIRTATPSDADWIERLLVEGAHGGHFGRFVADQARHLIVATLNHGGFQMIKARGTIQAPRFVAANLLVAEIADTPASFLMVLDQGQELELHLAGTTRTHRRQGAFAALISHEVEEHPEQTIIARCYRRSTWALAALTKAGFDQRSKGDPIELERRPLRS